uniref:snRNA-activating protein complex subunit 4 n=1 Tax=Sander lucioperca TaxID=283035 RepID=A0A8C9Y300_SANLU
MNLVYQQVVKETLDQLETLLTQNHQHQKELLSQLSGPMKSYSREQSAPSSCQQPISMFLGRFLKPYFKDKLTGLGPPANQEAKEKASRMTGSLDDRKLRVKRESWQKTLLIHSVTSDIFSQQQEKTEAELIGDQYDAHDWQKIANVDFEGTRDAEDIRRFWQNFLHPAVNKSGWSQEELQQLKELSRTHAERHWDHIAEQLGTGRTAFMFLSTFQRFVSDSLKRGSWTPAEDDMLRELVKEMRIGNFIPYTQISYFMEGRDPSQLIYRWNQVLDPSLKKGFWTKEEDELLLNAVSRYGEKDWWKIRFEVPGRTDSGCRDRYYDCLKAGTKKGPFDQQEKDLLRQLVKKHGVGRWAKIAAEIPDRYDAQCLREWRKLSKPPPPPPAQRIRKRLMKLQKEEMSEESSEDEAMVIEYMDSDEEEKKKKEEEVQIREEEEKEEEYIFPPMEEWIPVEEAQSNSSLSFRPAELPSSAVADNPVRVRSTIVGQYGRSVIIGPRPRQLQWEGHHGNSTMMMVTPSQLQTHLQRQAKNSGSQHASPRGKIQIDKNNPLGRVMDKRLSYKLQAAVTPWIGHLLIPAEEKKKRKVTAADALRERREKREPLSTPFFLLLLQSENVDALGCKEMIEQRRKKVVTMGPRPRPSLASTGGRKTVAGILYERKPMKVEQQELDLQVRVFACFMLVHVSMCVCHKLILNQLQALQQQQQQRAKQKQLLLQQHARQQQLMLRQQHALPSQNHPGFLLQMNPGMSFRQPVFIPVTQPCAPPIQFMSPSALNTAACRPPPVTVVTSPYPAHPASHRLGVPSSVTVVPVHLNATSTSPVSFRQQAVPLTQNPVSALAPYLAQQHVSIASTLPSQHVAPSESTASVTCPSPSSSMSTPHGNSLNHPVTPALQFTAGSPQFTTPQPTTAVSVPVNHPFMNQPHLLPARPTSAFRPHPPAFILQPVSNPRLPPPPPKLFLPYKGTVTADPTAPPPLRREALKFDPSLMFLEPQDAVQDWLSGQGGVVVPGLSVALPYLPPFVSSLSTLSALLRAKKSLTKSFLKLSAPQVDEIVAVARRLVAERFSSNPAYQLLKARFLSCFTVPALLAAVQPIGEKTAGKEEEEEDEVDVKTLKERGRRRRAEASPASTLNYFN